MAKKDPWANFNKHIGEMFEKEHQANIKLTPHKNDLENIVGLSKTLFEQTVLMKNSSDMAHQGIISFEVAQKIMDATKGRIKETLGYLETYLGLGDKDEPKNS